MKICLTEKSSGRQLFIPLLPNEVQVKTGANTIPINIIKTGEVRIPRGVKATGYSWDGTFPGISLSNVTFVTDWQEPKRIVAQLNEWRINNSELNLMVGEYINDDVFIEDFHYKYFGVDNIKYSITLTKAPNLFVTTSPAPPAKESQSSGGSGAAYPTGKVTGKKVTYRKGPGKEYAKLGTLKKGTVVTIYGTSGSWYKINQSPEWWIKSSYVKITSGEATKSKKSSSKKKKKNNSSSSNTNTNNSKKDLVANVASTKIVGLAVKAVKTVGTAAKVASAVSKALKKG